MSETLYRQVMREGVDEWMAEEKYARAACAIRSQILSGTWPEQYIDVFFQKFSRSPMDFVDVHCFAQIHYSMKIGKICSARIETGKYPSYDKDIEYNNGVLSSLFEPFYGKFIGGTGGCDGYIGWKKPLIMSQEIQDGRGGTTGLNCTIDPDKLPLEVGYTDSTTTLFHLIEGDGLARWPYGSSEIWLLYLLDREWFRGDLNKVEL